MPLRRALLLTLLLALLAVPAAYASSRQESMFQDDADDRSLVYGTPAEVKAEIDQLKALGVDRLRITVTWALVAPSYDATTRPNFDATDPAAYPAGAWDRYDTIVRFATAAGMKLNFNVTTPAPKWARERVPTDAESPRENDRFGSSFLIKPAEFADFMVALGRRYSGTYGDPQAPLTGGGVLGGGHPAYALPRVSYWSIWNEPNSPDWMAPLWRKAGSTWVPEAAVRYRRMFDAAWTSLQATGHGGDTILGGELKALGRAGHARLSFTKPLFFVRSLYCLDARYRTLRGVVAQRFGCPRSGSRAEIKKAHPGLFALTGWAHHPYNIVHPPDESFKDPDSAVLADLGRLEKTLDRTFSSFGSRRKLGLYLTEYGYQTNPPDPYMVCTPDQQAAYIDQATWMTVRNPRVQALSWYLLRDQRPNASLPKDDLLYWDTWQSGLYYADGRAKPSLAAYRLPLWLRQPRLRPRAALPVWGMVRPATGGVRAPVAVQLRLKGQKAFKTVRRLTVRSLRGTFTTSLRPSRSGQVRFSWASGGTTYYSRVAGFTVRR